MKRKVIKQGSGGFTVYLPKKWADKKGLKPGDQIDIKEKGTALILDTEVKEKKQISIRITEENKADLKNILTHLYRRGFDTITITNTSKELQDEIKKITNNMLLGFEVTGIEQNTCGIENISEPAGEKYDVMLRRIFLIIRETQRIISNDFKKSKFNSLKELREFRDQQDKFILFCRRILTKERFEIENPSLDWELLTFLMHIEHNYYYLYLYASKHKPIKEKKIIDLLDKLEEYFQLCYNAYYKKDIKYIHKINQLKEEYQFGKCYKYLEQARGQEAVILSHIRELFRLIQIGTSPILSEYFEKAQD
ncbi:MAG TPA: AbrB/MazE/SpoVT family DNA-binding domain-containing protein [Candidatus Woesearchaeota archaeon]|nr:AbrB/MazE/SpoVT family DNA-binding domain-containing protein [Candidatus Woesearchaeota archaeon]